MDDLQHELLTEAALGTLLGKHPRTLRRWRQLGEGPPWLPLGSGVRYLRASVLTWLSAQERRPEVPVRGRRG